MPDTSYAVVLTFSGGVSELIKKLRDEFVRYVSYTIEPHLTLKYPFVPKVDITIVNGELKAVARRTKPFTLVLNAIEYFEGTNNVAYIAVENKRPVIYLHTEIVNSLEGLIEVEDEKRHEIERFIPHVTIGENIPAGVFPSVKQRFSNYKTHYECKIADFSLFSEDKGIWSQEDTFEFQG